MYPIASLHPQQICQRPVVRGGRGEAVLVQAVVSLLVDEAEAPAAGHGRPGRAHGLAMVVWLWGLGHQPMPPWTLAREGQALAIRIAEGGHRTPLLDVAGRGLPHMMVRPWREDSAPRRPEAFQMPSSRRLRGTGPLPSAGALHLVITERPAARMAALACWKCRI